MCINAIKPMIHMHTHIDLLLLFALILFYLAYINQVVKHYP